MIKRNGTGRAVLHQNKFEQYLLVYWTWQCCRVFLIGSEQTETQRRPEDVLTRVEFGRKLPGIVLGQLVPEPETNRWARYISPDVLRNDHDVREVIGSPRQPARRFDFKIDFKIEVTNFQTKFRF